MLISQVPNFEVQSSPSVPVPSLWWCFPVSFIGLFYINQVHKQYQESVPVLSIHSAPVFAILQSEVVICIYTCNSMATNNFILIVRDKSISVKVILD